MSGMTANRRTKLEQDRLLIQQQLRTRRALTDGSNNQQLQQCLKRLIQSRKQGQCTQARFQVFAFNLYCSKPQIYKHLKPLLQLPDESIFQDFKIHLSPEFHKDIIYFVSSKISSLRPEVNHFVVCVDQYPLNKNYVYDTKRDVVLGVHNVNGIAANMPAGAAYVIVLRNLCMNWVLPVAYAFRAVYKNTHPQIAVWCAQVINKLQEIGIQVEAIVDRPETVWSNRNENSRTDFTFRGTTALEIHDIRMLCEGVRNCLIENDFYYNESRISWHYIKLLYYHQRDCASEPITDIKVHIHQTGGQGSQWRHARDLFSFEVYSALTQLINCGALPHEARPTAHFIQTMSELYRVATYGPYSSETIDVEHQIEVVERAAATFRNIHMRTSDAVPAPITHMVASLMGLAQLLRNMADKGFETVLTARLNKAPVDAFFRAVPRTADNGRRLRPTASQVYTAFVAAFARGLRRRPRYARREELAEAAASGLLDPRRVPRAALPPRSPLRLPRRLRYRVPLPPAPYAVHSFLLHACMQAHSCRRLEEALRPRRPLAGNFSGLELPDGARELWERLLEPPGVLLSFVDDLEEGLVKELKENLFRRPGAAALRALAQAARGRKLPCACFPRRLLLTLMVRMKMWLAVKRANKGVRRKERSTVARGILFSSGRTNWKLSRVMNQFPLIGSSNK